MHTENLTPHNNPHLELRPNADWFTDGGMLPNGELWVAPTPLFIGQIWHGCVGDDLRKRGFWLGHDGYRIGATQRTVIYLPANIKQTSRRMEQNNAYQRNQHRRTFRPAREHGH